VSAARAAQQKAFETALALAASSSDVCSMACAHSSVGTDRSCAAWASPDFVFVARAAAAAKDVQNRDAEGRFSFLESACSGGRVTLQPLTASRSLRDNMGSRLRFYVSAPGGCSSLHRCTAGES
jgi:hypothetical protein